MSTSYQHATLPLWNEILEVPVPALPCLATLMLEHRSSTSLATLAIFEVQLNEHLHSQFSDEWLISAPSTQTHDSSSFSPAKFQLQQQGATIKLRISCSFDAQLVARRQRGLWPTFHSTASAAIDDTTEVSPAELLMDKCPLSWSQARQHNGDAQQSALSGWPCLGRDSPVRCGTRPTRFHRNCSGQAALPWSPLNICP